MTSAHGGFTDAPASDEVAPDEGTDAAPPRRGATWARWRVAARMARRQIRRARLSSLLVATLIALPIAAMSGFIVYTSSLIGTPQEKTTVELGGMQAWIAPAGVPGEGFWQTPWEPEWTGYPIDDDGSMQIPQGAPVDDPMTTLPAGTPFLLLREGMAALETDGGTAALTAWAGEAWDPRFAGAFDLVDGRRPANGREAMATEAALERIGVGIGDEIRLAGDGRTFTVVGTLDAAEIPDRQPAVFLPATASDVVRGTARWYLPDTELSWPDVQRLNEQGVVAYARDVVLDPPPFRNAIVSSMSNDWWSAMWPVVFALAVGGLFAGYVVVMLAGAAFAVTARRQQRALAVAASVGADRRDLSRTILLQGAVLGLAGGVPGVIGGVALAALVMALTHNGSATQFWGFHVPWPVLAAILAFAVVVGTLAAWMPARTVARGDVLRALRGAQRPQRPVASRPVWGSVLLLLGIAITVAGAFAIAAVNASAIPWDSPLRYVPAYGIVVGPIMAQIGILLSGRWLLWMSSRLLSRVGVAAKLASRDAAANASRTVPAFAAIAATVFLGVFAVATSAMQTAQTGRNWFYDAPLGSISISIWAGVDSTSGIVASEHAEAGAVAAVDIAREAGGEAIAVLRRQQPTVWLYPSAADVPDDLFHTVAVMPQEHLLDPASEGPFTSMGQDPGNPLSVVAPDELATATGIELSASELSAYRAGAALVADARFVTDATIRVETFAGADFYDGRVPDNIWRRGADGPPLAEPLRSERLKAIVVDAPLQPIVIAVAPATADRLGLVTQPERVIASIPGPLSTEDRDRVRAQSEAMSTAYYSLGSSVQEGPPSSAAWMVPLLTAVGVLVLGASAVALGLARFERRPDDATLAAVGGTRALRRGIGFWQGLLIAGFGTAAGALAGVLPPIGFAIQSQGSQQLADVPWIVLAGVVVLLPVAIAVANWLVPPRHAGLTRRTAIT